MNHHPQAQVVIDFDSTFMKVEALEELAEIVLNGNENKEAVLDEIKNITNLGVDGKIGFNESLSRRLRTLMPFTRDDLDKLIERLLPKVSTSFSRNKAFFEEYKGHVYIISNGFKEFIEPVVAPFHIEPDHVLANTFTYNDNVVTGFDQTNPLAHSKGKSRALAALGLEGEIYVIGDSYTDYEMKEAGIAHKFYAFTENVLRENILDRADHITPSLDEFLYVNNMPRAISYPKNRIKALLLEGIHPGAAAALAHEGYQVETMDSALSEDELCEAIRDVSLLGIRSKTQLTERAIDASNRLMAVGAFCIGTNQIDLQTCLQKGVPVFNAPYSNTRSVVELALAEIILLMRRIPYLNHHMHAGTWNKSAKDSNEVRGKTLGIIGYGNIGKQLSVLAEAAGMHVVYYDIVERLALGNATKCSSLKELLLQSDAVSLHVDGRPENEVFFTAEHFSYMRQGSVFLNLSRGQVVDIEALTKALDSGKLRGAAVDVYPKEPKSNDEPFESELLKYPNVILSPHIGGSTQEAQENIGEFVPGRFIEYINTGSTTGSVNFPEIQLPELRNAHRLIHIHRNVPGIMSQMNRIMADHDINIVGQYLKTNEEIGYVITDVNKAYDDDLLDAMKGIEHTIKFRVLY
ncbi:MAG: phosphoglycerate dehydrogenase [Bacteroidia bacterium]